MSDAIVRLMDEKDVDAVFIIEQQSFNTPWSRAAFVNEIDNDIAHYLVLEADGKVIGYGGMWLIVGEAHVTNIAVLPEWRRRGFGKKLLSAMIDYAKTNGAHSMTLEVRVSNTAARQLYEGFGFRNCGCRSGYYSDNNEDAIIMWLELK